MIASTSDGSTIILFGNHGGEGVRAQPLRSRRQLTPLCDRSGTKGCTLGWRVRQLTPLCDFSGMSEDFTLDWCVLNFVRQGECLRWRVSVLIQPFIGHA